MAVSYDKLWKLLVDKKMSRAELRKAADISSNTLTRMIKDEPVTLELLSRICNKLDCDFGDIVTYVPDEKNISDSHGEYLGESYGIRKI